jgi:hypothetical protein
MLGEGETRIGYTPPRKTLFGFGPAVDVTNMHPLRGFPIQFCGQDG